MVADDNYFSFTLDEIKKTLKEGALPRYRLPEKTLQAKVPTERPSGHILKREATVHHSLWQIRANPVIRIIMI